MEVITGIMLFFSILGGIDRICGNRFGLGKEFEKGFMLLGSLTLSMIGMIVLSPLLADLMRPALNVIHERLHIDPSMVTSSLFANDLGGAALAREVAVDSELGRFSGLIVTSMMGGTISFTIPYALNAVQPNRHEPLLLGMLCGIIAIPVGCLLGGLIQRIPVGQLLASILPLLILSIMLAVGLMCFPQVCTKVFGVIGKILQILITIGLMLAIIRFLTGREIISGLNTLEEASLICLNAAVVMTGAFPLLSILSRILKRPLNWLSERIGINETASVGLVSCLANSMTTFEMMQDMDHKGIVVNSAFAVSAAFVFGDHLAFTLAFDAAYTPGMIVGKLSAGVLGIVFACLMYGHLVRTGKIK